MSTHNICYLGGLRKIFTRYPLPSRLMLRLPEHVQSHPGFCSPFKHSVISNDSVREQ